MNCKAQLLYSYNSSAFTSCLVAACLACWQPLAACCTISVHALQLAAEAMPKLLQDWLDIDFAIQMDVDFIAVSFVKTADVINNLKSYLSSRSSKVIEIVAKIESHDSVPNAQDIIEASDAVMIARGDLGMTSSLCA